MSRLVYNGQTHQVSLIDNQGRTVGNWTAYNNVDSHATLRHLPNGNFTVQDTRAPHPHGRDANGPYGSHGIVRFNVPGHTGIGLHSGRAGARYLPGPQHPTMGCIRTTDAAMQAIAGAITNDPLTTMAVTNNSATAAQNGVRHAHHRHGGQAHAAH